MTLRVLCHKVGIVGRWISSQQVIVVALKGMEQIGLGLPKDAVVAVVSAVRDIVSTVGFSRHYRRGPHCSSSSSRCCCYGVSNLDLSKHVVMDRRHVQSI